MLLSIFTISCARSHLDGLLLGHFVPHMHHIRVPGVGQCLFQQLWLKEVSPMFPGYGVEGITIEYPEAHATLLILQHQRNILGATNTLCHTCYHSWSIVAPIASIEILLEFPQTRFGNLMPESIVCQAHDARG